MELDRELLQIAKLLLSADSSQRSAEILLYRVLEATAADRGFIVVREAEGYAQKLALPAGGEHRSREARRFSRNLVRQAIETGEAIESANVLEDPRFARLESVQRLGSSSVLAAPLRAAGEVYGVVYLQSKARPEGFGTQAREFLAEFSEIAGQFLRKALEREELERRYRSLERDLFAQHNFKGIVTRHPKMLELLEVVAQVADSDATVLILGETGTGKELIAQALHWNSSRRNKPFVALHCTALPGPILESELFGHVRGAFTGAERERAGRIASAEGGTLFLDEIAEIPRKLQAKLLRFLQFGEIQRLGSDKVEKVDVRVLAATHRNLRAMVRAKRFRADLYYRLNVLELRIAPLRERGSDIPLLVDHFVRKHWRRADETPRWSPDAQELLQRYAYPGNVRELEHLVERACLLARGPEMGVELLPPELSKSQSTDVREEPGDLSKEGLRAAREAAVAAVERQFLDALMARCGGNVSQAARGSGLHRSQLQRLLAEHRVPVEKGEPDPG
jgi:Nif-specific regulatory protein/two-component system response regulator HydG